MNLTLRDARRMDQEIEKLVQRMSKNIKLTEVLSVYHAPLAPSGIKQKERDIIEDIGDITLLSNFRFALREKIQEANRVQVDTLTLRLAQQEAVLALIENIPTQEVEDPYHFRGRDRKKRINVVDVINVDEVNAQLAGMRQAVQNGSAVITYELKLYTKTLMAVLDKLSSDCRKEINKTKDELIKANNDISVKIELTAAIEDLLKENGLSVG